MVFRIIRRGNPQSNNSNSNNHQSSNHSNHNSNQQKKTTPQFLSDEWLILNFLRDWTADDIRLAIKNKVDLAKLLRENMDNPLAGSLTGITHKYDVQDERVNVGNILLWFAENRPDIYIALTESEEGVAWLIWNMNNLKKML